MLVKNLSGTSDSPNCPCGSWIKHWENHTHVGGPRCFEASCREPATDGAHVQKTNGDKSWYIIPLCKAHNGLHGQIIEVLDSYEQFFVSATTRENCR